MARSVGGRLKSSQKAWQPAVLCHLDGSIGAIFLGHLVKCNAEGADRIRTNGASINATRRDTHLITFDSIAASSRRPSQRPARERLGDPLLEWQVRLGTDA